MNSKYKQINRPKQVKSNKYNDLQKEFNNMNKNTNQQEYESSDDSIPSEIDKFQSMIHKNRIEDASLQEMTCRLVINRLDFDKINSKDIYVLCNSFLPTGGSLEFVKIYHSNYGRMMLEKEQQNGPDLNKFSEQAFLQQIAVDKQILKQYKRMLQQHKVEKLEQLNKEQKQQLINNLLNNYKEFQQLVADQKIRLYEEDKLEYYYCICQFNSVQTCCSVFSNIDRFEFESAGLIVNCLTLTDDIYKQMQLQQKFNISEQQGGYLKEQCTELPVDYQYSLIERIATLQTKPKFQFDQEDKERSLFMKKLRMSDQNVDKEILNKYFNFECSEASQNEDGLSEKLQENEEEQQQLEEEEEQEEDEEKITNTATQQQPKFQLNFQPIFDNKNAQQINQKIEETPFQKLIQKQQKQNQERTTEWEYREQQKQKNQSNNLQKNASREVQSYYKKLVKQLTNEDNNKYLKVLAKKKQKLEEKYPDLKQLSDKQLQIVQYDDERFKEVFEGGDADFDACQNDIADVQLLNKKIDKK